MSTVVLHHHQNLKNFQSLAVKGYVYDKEGSYVEFQLRHTLYSIITFAV